MHPIKSPRKRIEVAVPLDDISAAVSEKSIHQGPPTEEPSSTSATGEVARQLAVANVGAVFGEPLAWQRREREDHALPMPDDNP